METDLNFKATELRLGLPGRDEYEEMMKTPKNSKRALPESNSGSEIASSAPPDIPPASKAQIVGWPPVRSCWKSNVHMKKHSESEPGIYVKVSMDGAPYLRKIDLKVYDGYSQLLQALKSMFKLSIGEYSEREGYKGSEYLPAYEDKDGDLMLVGDVPWDMFKSSCKKLRIMKGSEARGLGFGV